MAERRSALASLFLAGLLLAGCGDSLSPPRPERAAIAEAAREIAATPPPRIVARPPQQDLALLRRVAERTAAAAQPFCEAELGRACRFSVDLARANVPNAYASGQDRITFTTALMSVIRNEDELAAIMAHEMAHHIARHIPESTWRVEAGARVGAWLGNAVATAIGYDPGLTQLGAEAGAHVASLTFSKAQEREADYLGAWITARAGYDLERAGSIWATLTQLSGDKVTSMTDTHPAGPERLAQWRRVAAEIARDPESGPRRA
ncbi:M48 family metalloprotease [Roseomonas sp. AR75]|uniref:M48 family metalloprotease n=1 Tax=Roseomonas sp. AR75 TaxID=2562311 RepID=UPI0014850408|nr:M48 family metalloprotease [Roseomonas sp. AR75]